MSYGELRPLPKSSYFVVVVFEEGKKTLLANKETP